jgi:hypothetical protein
VFFIYQKEIYYLSIQTEVIILEKDDIVIPDFKEKEYIMHETYLDEHGRECSREVSISLPDMSDFDDDDAE